MLAAIKGAPVVLGDHRPSHSVHGDVAAVMVALTHCQRHSGSDSSALNVFGKFEEVRVLSLEWCVSLRYSIVDKIGSIVFQTYTYFEDSVLK